MRSWPSWSWRVSRVAVAGPLLRPAPLVAGRFSGLPYPAPPSWAAFPSCRSRRFQAGQLSRVCAAGPSCSRQVFRVAAAAASKLAGFPSSCSWPSSGLAGFPGCCSRHPPSWQVFRVRGPPCSESGPSRRVFRVTAPPCTGFGVLAAGFPSCCSELPARGLGNSGNLPAEPGFRARPFGKSGNQPCRETRSQVLGMQAQKLGKPVTRGSPEPTSTHMAQKFAKPAARRCAERLRVER